jgi:predicted small integral membrane protein
VTFLLLAIGAIAMLLAIGAPATGFQRAKLWVVAGVTLGFLVWFFGFMVVGGEYFAMWQSKTWNGQEAAFRFYITMLAVLIYVMQPDGEFE